MHRAIFVDPSRLQDISVGHVLLLTDHLVLRMCGYGEIATFGLVQESTEDRWGVEDWPAHEVYVPGFTD